MPAPRIDPRCYDDIVSQIRALATLYSGWTPRDDGQPDAGSALIGIFGRFMELVIDRLNQVPEKNYLAFLNLIGADLLPPQPARVPLTFTLAANSPVDAVVSAGTQVAAPPAEGEEEEVVFETDQDLVVTRAKLKAVLVREPAKDRYGDYTERALGDNDEAFPAFSGDQPIEHSLYLACDDLFTLPGPKTISLTFDSPEVSRLAELPLTWSYWDGMTWEALSRSAGIEKGLAIQVKANSVKVEPGSAVDGQGRRINLTSTQSVDLSGYQDQTVYLVISYGQELSGPTVQAIPEAEAGEYPVNTYLRLARLVVDAAGKISESVESAPEDHKWTVTIRNLPVPASCEINGQEDAWLRARLDRSLPPFESPLPQIGKITAQVKVERSGLAPDLALANSVPLDLSKDFYPFGEQPRFNDTLYLASAEAYSRPSAQVTVHLSLSDPQPIIPKPSNDLEIAWEAWTGDTWTKLEPSESPNGVAKFTESGTLTFVLPKTIGPRPVNGETGHWIRARIVKGGFGTPVMAVWDAEQNKIEMTGGFGPPSVASLSLEYTYEQEGPLSGCQTCNDLICVDRAAEAAEGPAFEPFTPDTEKQPALYLGFDQKFDSRPVSLYVQVEPPQADEMSHPLPLAARPQVTWEYANADGAWTPLGTLDETQGFAGRGLIRFIGPRDFARRQLFGRELYWVRARLESGEFPVLPHLRRLLLNTTWASQTTTIQNETLGSSNGNPGQVFRLAQAPVLPGLCLQVREPGMPSPEEEAEITKLEGPDAITTILDAAGHPEAIWVRWHAVPDFRGSGPRDRHYTIDYLTGTIRFGDGRYGLIPPPGQNNIRAARYRSGGGAGGNRPRETVIQLKSSVPYIDRVTNFEEASGGADRQSLERVKRYGPRQLRHRGRAVTFEDFEDLVYAASAEVARAKAIPTSRDDGTRGGVIGLIVVPRSDAPQPIPSLGLLEQVKGYLQARCPATAELWVAGPDWVKVTVTTDVVPTSLAVADQVEIRLKAALERFLHPLTGGPLGKGWPFGRLPHPSDLYALIESVEGVDHVRALTVDSPPAETGPFLIYSGQHQITLGMA